MMSPMRSTVRIDDDLMAELKERARRENVSQTRMLNRLLRAGLDASDRRRGRKKPYREKSVSMGKPRIDLDKAAALAGELEDEEILRKLSLQK